jgi:hypothetical protein
MKPTRRYVYSAKIIILFFFLIETLYFFNCKMCQVFTHDAATFTLRLPN